MRLLDRITARWQTRAQGYYEGMASGASVLMTFGTDDRREKAVANLLEGARQAYSTNGLVFALILARQMLLSEATFTFRAKKDKHLFGTEDLRILEVPWPNGTAGDLWARMEQDVSLEGNCFLWAAEPDRIVRLPPGEVTIVSEEVRAIGGGAYKEIVGYDWDPKPTPPTRSPEAQFFGVDEIAHWSPIPDPSATVRGMSWLTPVLRNVAADTAMTTYKSGYFQRGNAVQAIKYAQKLQPETVDFIASRIEAKYGGAANAWRPLVFDQGADPVMSKGLADLDFRAVAAADEDAICAASGVPPVIVGLRSAEPTQSYPEAMRRFADLTCRPLWRSGCAALQKLVPNVPPRGVQLWFDTSDIAALQAAETERAQVTQVSAAAVLTFVQAGMTRESVVAAVTSGDLSQLVPDPNAPTPGVAERETVTAAESTPVTGPDSSGSARPAKVGAPPGGGGTLTKPQTPMSKEPMPASFPTAATNGKG